MDEQDLDKAIELLKSTVKESHVKNLKHIDLTLIPAETRAIYQNALLVARTMVDKGKITEAELKARLGI